MFALAKPLCRLILAPAILLCCLGLPGIESFTPSAHAAPGANKSVVAKKGKKKGKKGKKKGKKAKKAAAQAAVQ